MKILILFYMILISQPSFAEQIKLGDFELDVNTSSLETCRESFLQTLDALKDRSTGSEQLSEDFIKTFKNSISPNCKTLIMFKKVNFKQQRKTKTQKISESQVMQKTPLIEANESLFDKWNWSTAGSFQSNSGNKNNSDLKFETHFSKDFSKYNSYTKFVLSFDTTYQQKDPSKSTNEYTNQAYHVNVAGKWRDWFFVDISPNWEAFVDYSYEDLESKKVARSTTLVGVGHLFGNQSKNNFWIKPSVGIGTKRQSSNAESFKTNSVVSARLKMGTQFFSMPFKAVANAIMADSEDYTTNLKLNLKLAGRSFGRLGLLSINLVRIYKYDNLVPEGIEKLDTQTGLEVSYEPK